MSNVGRTYAQWSVHDFQSVLHFKGNVIHYKLYISSAFILSVYAVTALHTLNTGELFERHKEQTLCPGMLAWVRRVCGDRLEHEYWGHMLCPVQPYASSAAAVSQQTASL